jgi:hypothetical protein
VRERLRDRHGLPEIAGGYGVSLISLLPIAASVYLWAGATPFVMRIHVGGLIGGRKTFASTIRRR